MSIMKQALCTPAEAAVLPEVENTRQALVGELSEAREAYQSLFLMTADYLTFNDPLYITASDASDGGAKAAWRFAILNSQEPTVTQDKHGEEVKVYPPIGLGIQIQAAAEPPIDYDLWRAIRKFGADNPYDPFNPQSLAPDQKRRQARLGHAIAERATRLYVGMFHLEDSEDNSMQIPCAVYSEGEAWLYPDGGIPDPATIEAMQPANAAAIARSLLKKHINITPETIRAELLSHYVNDGVASDCRRAADAVFSLLGYHVPELADSFGLASNTKQIAA
jgi:hypothetical protein